MVRISSTLSALIMWIFVPMRTKHERMATTRNIMVKTWTRGDLLESVMTLCVELMLGDPAATVTWRKKGENEETKKRMTAPTLEREKRQLRKGITAGETRSHLGKSGTDSWPIDSSYGLHLPLVM
jgi:hypothetical protein